MVAPGNGTSRDAGGRARWDSHGAVDEITLVGGPLVVYREAAGAVEALAYLRQKDDALASKYLEATAQYLEMYRGLVGPYPYSKFALVENFWETGYGMPSYTLLGPQVIRFPFILTSSYPHEILHNWWGNSVFVDYASGNWCEGLTAYMADHLIQEQRGQGEAYRRDTLQKYRSYVKDGRDFPLTEFRSRHSAATEAVGYGKTLMLFHMLRQRLGDDGFRQWAARFYRENRGKQASFSDIRKRHGSRREAGPGPALHRSRGAAGRGRAARVRHCRACDERRRIRGDGDARRDAGGCAARARGAAGRADGRCARAGDRAPGHGPGSLHRGDRSPAARAPRGPVVRRLPPARPARDAGVDRPDLRRAEDPGGAAGAGARGRAGRLSGPHRRLAQRQPPARGPHGRRDPRAAERPRGLDPRPRQRPGVAALRLRRRLHARRPDSSRSTASRCRSPVTSA